MTTTSTLANEHRVVSREAWLKERLALLSDEKKLTRQHDAIASKIRDLPWVKVGKTYTFDALTGKKSLADLFESHSQLIVYHFMFDPTWSQGCKSCSFIADHYNGTVVHLAHRDISFVTVSKAPIEKMRSTFSSASSSLTSGWTRPISLKASSAELTAAASIRRGSRATIWARSCRMTRESSTIMTRAGE